MNSPAERQVQWHRHAAYRYGMFVLIMPVLAISLWYAFVRPGKTSHAEIGLITAVMLLFNHVVESFLPDAQQKAVRIPQFILVFGGLAYVLFVLVREWR